MSKSKGNVVDPLAVMDTYGTDAFRFALVAFAAMGRDIKLAEDRIEGYRNFMNKIWNAARFVLMQLEDAGVGAPRLETLEADEYAALGIADQWILSRLTEAVAEVNGALDEYRFNDAASRLYEFAWHEFCDWYLEMAKVTLGAGGAAAAATRRTLVRVLESLLRLLHPFVPFISEEIWQSLERAPGDADSIVRASYPQPRAARTDGAVDRERWRNPPVEERVGRLIGIVRAVRNIRAEMNLPPGRQLAAALVLGGGASQTQLATDEAMLRTLARLHDLRYLAAGERVSGAATALVDGVQIFVPLAGIVDLEEEERRLTREIGKVTGELAGIERKLDNPAFRERAPEEIVEEQQQKAATLAAKKATLERSLKTLADARAG
jgi:valyl-tRNA synthetase